jgi:multiple sugar transport system permease protein
VALYLLSMENAPLPLALVNMRQQTMGVIDYGATTAGVVVLTIPAVVLFLALQRYYVKGFTSGAVKG